MSKFEIRCPKRYLWTPVSLYDGTKINKGFKIWFINSKYLHKKSMRNSVRKTSRYVHLNETDEELPHSYGQQVDVLFESVQPVAPYCALGLDLDTHLV